MAVNDSSMLPEKVRSMSQMEDLLQAEQVLLTIIEAIILDMITEVAISNYLPMIKENVEMISTAISGNASYINEYPETLTIDVVVSRNTGAYTCLPKLRNYLNSMLPAHLKFNIYYELRTIISIFISSRYYKISHDMCGEGYSGEFPDISMVGLVRHDKITTNTKAKGHAFNYPLTGEYPDISMVGAINHAIVITKASASSYIYDFSLTGEHPEISTTGVLAEATMVPDVSSSCFLYETQYCSDDDFCGED